MTLQRWPVVGRRSELEIFEQALGPGERAGLVIYGRAGVGKTRLADECADMWRSGNLVDAATSEAWRLACNLVAETMLDGAAAARPTGS